MATTLLSLPLQPARPAAERHCPIRIISVQLLDAAGQLLRVLFLDREGHITAQRDAGIDFAREYELAKGMAAGGVNKP